ncbi:unnamed protein product, partial [marine sediment metagenome]
KKIKKVTKVFQIKPILPVLFNGIIGSSVVRPKIPAIKPLSDFNPI